MNVVYAERARDDIDEIYQFIAAQSRSTAQRAENRIRSACERLVDFPGMGSRTDEPDIWRLPLARYRFTIFYRYREGSDVVEIARVVRGVRVKDLRSLPD